MLRDCILNQTELEMKNSLLAMIVEQE